jgi:UDP-N-acetylmuramoylalanine--D-glutamate ligase
VFRAEGREESVLRTDEVKLLGQHNLENISAAVTAAFLAQARVSEVQKVVRKFKGLEHRLEKVAEIAGVTYINDSYSTTPQTTIAALKSFSAPIILICGGRSKGGDYEALARAIFESPVKAVLLIGEMAFKLKELIQKVQKQKAKPIEILNLGRLKLKTVVQKAAQKAQSGEVVLFSPGCASFDMFQNATQRGLEFKKAVLSLLK